MLFQDSQNTQNWDGSFGGGSGVSQFPYSCVVFLAPIAILVMVSPFLIMAYAWISDGLTGRKRRKRRGDKATKDSGESHLRR